MTRLRRFTVLGAVCGLLLMAGCEGGPDATGTVPMALDSDGDGLPDDAEATAGTNPSDPDSDHDGLFDGDEVSVYATDPTAADSDGDGLSDLEEVQVFGSDPWNTDTDGDGLLDGAERNLGTSPTNPDHDGGGVSDGDEVAAGTNPHWGGDDHGPAPTDLCYGQCNDGATCTTDTCDPATGACTYTPVADGTACQGTGQCVAGACKMPTCQPSWCNDGNTCTDDFCAGGPLGSCDHAAVADGTTCPGGACQAGVCQSSGGSGGPCYGQCEDGNPCTDDVCDATDGSCSYAPINQGLSCYGSGICVDGTCSFDEGLQPGDAVCSGCADDNPCTIDFCLADGTCTYNAGNEGIKCSDGHTCQAGVCAPAACILDECDDGNPCTVPSCDSGACERTPVADGGSCFFDGGLGACQAGTCVPKTCSEKLCGALDDPCLGASCPDGPLGACGPLVPVNEGMECGDGGAVCVSGVCINVTCDPAKCDDLDPCTSNGCGDDGTCEYEPMPVGTPCGDGGVCLPMSMGCSAPVNGQGGSAGTNYGDGETECNGLDDNGDGKIDEGDVCPYPVHQFGGPEMITDGGGFAGGHAYMFVTDSVNPQLDWFEAKALCASYGYHLVFINSPAEGQFVHEWINSDTDAVGYVFADTWLGARQEPDSSEWAWQDNLDPWAYEDFSGFVFNPTDDYNYDTYGACAYMGDHVKTHWDVSPCSYDRSVVCEAGPETPDGPLLEPTDYINGKCYYDYDGNDDFGAGYSICAFVQMNEGAQPGDLPSYLRAFAEAKGFARLFSHDLTILGAMAQAVATNTEAFAETRLTVMGADVFGLRLATKITIEFSLDVTFVEMTQIYLIGFVPVTLSASIGGSLGIRVDASAGLGGIALTPTPFAEVIAAGSVGVGVKGVQVKLEISLVLLGLAIPVEVDLILPSLERLDWSVDIDLTVYTLNGGVAIVVEIGFIKIIYTIFEWDGFEWVLNLYDREGSIYF